MRYIANMRKQELVHEAGASAVLQAAILPADWYKSLDLRREKIRESKRPPSGWVNTLLNGDVLSHLLTLHYHQLNDAINVGRSLVGDTSTGLCTAATLDEAVESATSETMPESQLMQLDQEMSV